MTLISQIPAYDLMNSHFHSVIGVISLHDHARQTRIPFPDASGLPDSDRPADADNMCSLLGPSYRPMLCNATRSLADKEYVWEWYRRGCISRYGRRDIWPPRRIFGLLSKSADNNPRGTKVHGIALS